MRSLDGGITTIMQASPKACLLCFSHLRWSFVFQRPQHLMTLAARHYHVLYLEEPLFERAAKPHLRSAKDASGVEVLTPVLPEGLAEGEIVRIQALLTRGKIAELGLHIHICWYYTPMAYEFSHMIVPDLRVYDCMDELTAFKGASRRLAENERRLLTATDLVFTGGASLFEAKRALHRAVYAYPSSVDQTHFRKCRTRDLREPEAQSHLKTPRIGYYGVIDERMDLDLVEASAKLRPDFQYVLVGPVTKIPEASLPRLDNLHWLGRQDYAVLPNFVSGWDVAFMPFAMNESTRFISPTKTPEFLAAGIPVVSTPVRDVVRPYGERGLVRIAETPESMVAAIEASLSATGVTWLRKVDDFLAGMSWENTWNGMREHLLAAASISPPDRSKRGRLSSTAVSPARVSHV